MYEKKRRDIIIRISKVYKSIGIIKRKRGEVRSRYNKYATRWSERQEEGNRILVARYNKKLVILL